MPLPVPLVDQSPSLLQPTRPLLPMAAPPSQRTVAQNVLVPPPLVSPPVYPNQPQFFNFVAQNCQFQMMWQQPGNLIPLQQPQQGPSPPTPETQQYVGWTSPTPPFL
jgi:hypothetical protein